MIVKISTTILLLLFTAFPLFSQWDKRGGGSITGEDEGVGLGTFTILDAVGAGVTATLAADQLTLTIPGGGSATFTVEENDVSVSAAINILDFLGADFDVTESPAGEANIVIASAIARDSELHDAVTVSGTPDYITLSAQDIVRGLIDLATDVTGVLPSANIDDPLTLNRVNLDSVGVETANANLVMLSRTVGDILLQDSTTVTGLVTADGLTLGANENITLGAQTLDHDGTNFVFDDDVSLGSNSLRFSTGGAPSHLEGQLFYDDEEGALAFHNNESEITLQIGQEFYKRVRNESGSTILNGAVVYVTGTESGGESRLLVDLAQSNTESTSRVIGLATHDIENNTYGYVTVVGQVNDFDTSALTEGAPVWLSETTAGGLTESAPVTPNFDEFIGYVVVSNASTGSVMVNINPDLEAPAGEATMIVEPARKGSAGTISLGEVVYVSGYNVGQGVREVELADASAAATMPGLGIASSTITNSANGDVVMYGLVTGLNTSAFSVNDALYVSETPGALTDTKPTGTALVQAIARVIRSNASNGLIEVVGAGRSNDLPNLPDTEFWVGNGSGVPTGVSMSSEVTMANTGATTITRTTAFDWTGAHTWARAGVAFDFQNTTDASTNQLGIFRGGNRATPADNDSTYFSFFADTDLSGQEFARLTYRATDVTNTSKDADLIFSVMVADVLTNVFSITGTGVNVPGIMLAGTVIGTNVTTGANPGHTHTSTSISGLLSADMADEDWGDGSFSSSTFTLDANVVASAEISDNSVTRDDVEAELRTHVFGWTYEFPVVTTSAFSENKLPFAFTITEIACHTDVGTADINVEERAEATPNTAGTDAMSSDLQCTTTQAEQTSFSNAGFAINTWPYLTVSAVATSPTKLTVTVRGTID